MTDDGFIERFSNFVLDSIPTSPMWAESVALGILGTAVGRGKRTVTRRGELNLNIWFMYVGTSGIANKTTPLKYFVHPMIDALEARLPSPKPGQNPTLELPSRFSIEGIIQYMSKYTSEGIIIRDEFTSVFKDMNKDYMADLTEFLSEMYDGTVQKRFTKSAQLEQTRPAYVTLLAATTPFLYTILKLDFFLQGLGNRILYITNSVEDYKVERETYDDFFQNPNDLTQDRASRFESFAGDLLALRDMSTRYIWPMEEAGNLILDYKYETEMDLVKRNKSNVYDVYAPYMARLPEMVYKLTALRTLSREYQTLPVLQSDIAMSSYEDAKWAIEKVRHHFEHFRTMVELWRMRPEPTLVRTIDEQMGTLLDLLSDKDRGLGWSDVRAKIHWPIFIFGEVLHQVWDTKRVFFLLRKQQSGAGRPTLVLCAAQHLPTSIANGEEQIEDWNLVKIKLSLR